MIISFRPSTTGNRSARVVVSDPAGGRSTTLVLTGLGAQLAALGQSCVNADCSSGVCTRGVCCDRACDRTCQVCSAQGQCIDQNNQQACGNGAACFGVDNCKLPAGRACSQNGGDAQCGSGQCERRLGGNGPGDRICCLDDCGNSLQCNAQNRCQAPTLGDGEACGAPGQLQCGAGLVCKACRGGGNRCTPPDGCCGGCDNPLECSGGQCVCRVLSNGQRGINCGGGVCAINRENACCVGFEPAGCNCDSRDNLCKQCLIDDHCANGQVCQNNQCRTFTVGLGQGCEVPANCTAGTCQQGTCRCGAGTKECNGGCIANAACCGGCPAGQTCDDGQCRFLTVGLGQACNQQAQNCQPGQSCQGGTCQCAGTNNDRCGNTCVNLDSDGANCGVCGINCGGVPCRNGFCDCPDGSEFIAGRCRLGDTAPCRTSDPGQCASNVCTEWFFDLDGDDFGVGEPDGIGECGEVQLPTSTGSNVKQGGDCCDVQQPGSSSVFPGATVPPATIPCPNVTFNCR
jgi:hypothetical protein